jgi:hypothetical protein
MAILQSMLKTAAATATFGLVHSVLASSTAKQWTEHWLGHRARNGLYRPLYLVQSMAGMALLIGFVRRLPSKELYRIEGPLELLMRGGQVAGLAYAVWAAREAGIGRLTGLEGFLAWTTDEAEVPRELEAQGPAPDFDSHSEGHGEMRALGPFQQSRHPLNLSPLPVFWLQPRMTTNLLAFNLVATTYLVLGSKHEESRLRAAYGPAYERYRRSGVPFYIPLPLSPLATIPTSLRAPHALD